MKQLAEKLRAAANTPLHTAPEHCAQHTRFLRAAVEQTGKTITQLSADEIVELNKIAQQKTEAQHDC